MNMVRQNVFTEDETTCKEKSKSNTKYYFIILVYAIHKKKLEQNNALSKLTNKTRNCIYVISVKTVIFRE